MLCQGKKKKPTTHKTRTEAINKTAMEQRQE